LIIAIYQPGIDVLTKAEATEHPAFLDGHMFQYPGVHQALESPAYGLRRSSHYGKVLEDPAVVYPKPGLTFMDYWSHFTGSLKINEPAQYHGFIHAKAKV
jgi:hypothetical protein